MASASVWALIHEVKHSKVQAKANQEEKILNGVQDLVKLNELIDKEVTKMSKESTKMLFMVATYARYNGEKVLSRRKKGFIFEGNDYYTPEYTNKAKSAIKAYHNKHKLDEYPGADYIIKDLQDIKQEFLVSYNNEVSEDKSA